MVRMVESRDDRALVRSTWDGGLGDEAGMGEAGNEHFNDPETVSTDIYVRGHQKLVVGTKCLEFVHHQQRVD